MGFYYDSLLAQDKYTYRLLGPTYKGGTFNSDNYSVIIRDFIRDPLSFQIDHSWTGLQESKISDFFSTFIKSKDEAIQNLNAKYNNFKSGFGSTSGYAFQDYLTASEYVKVFKSTNISLPLSLSTVFISDGVSNASTRLTHLLEYFVGTVTDSDLALNSSGSNIERIKDLVVTVNAPHGFKNLTATNRHATNSLILYYGEKAWLDDLIVTNVRVDMSKEMGFDGSPLMITVNFNLAPCRLFSAKELKNFISSATEITSTLLIPQVELTNMEKSYV